MSITIQDLNNIACMVKKNFVEFPVGIRLSGMTTKLDRQEIMAICYYKGVVQYLVSKGKLEADFDLGLNFIDIDSGPDHEDYE
jgi:hypothetical protein